MVSQSNGQDIDLMPMYGNEPFSQPHTQTEEPLTQTEELLIQTDELRPQGILLPEITLQQAARDGKEGIVRILLQNNKCDFKDKKQNPINVKDADGLTALHYAARFNKYQILQHLLLEEPEVDLKTEQGFTALHYAAKYLPRISNEDAATDDEAVSSETTEKLSSAIAINWLLRYGANVNAKDDDGVTPLAVACQRGNYYGVKALLKADMIEVNQMDHQHSTPLHEACENGSKKIVDLLIKKGANITYADKDGVIPLHIACGEGCTDVVSLLLLSGHAQKDILVSAQDSQGTTALHYAAESGVESIIRMLLLAGADPLAQKHNLATPLHIAARNGHIEIAKLLLQYNEQQDININIVEMTEREQNTPLHFAARHDQCEMIRFLVQKGKANIEALDVRLMTPLLTAVSWSKLEAVKCFIELGAKIDTIDKDGKSGLFLAARLNELRILKEFVKHKEGKELCSGKDSFNNHLLHIACKNGNFKVLKYLVELEDPKLKTTCRNEESQTPLHFTAKFGHLKCMQKMIEVNKELIPLVDDQGNTALHLACIYGFPNIAKELIEKGAAVDVRNDKQWTPMDCAASEGHAKLINLLIEHNAPIDAKDRSQETPLTLACKEGRLNCVKVLVEGGADVTHTAQQGLNCLDLAIENGHEHIAQYLVTCKQWEATLKNCTGKMTPLRRLIIKMPDIAVTVFNRCTKDNNGDTIPVVDKKGNQTGTELVTRDSVNFKVTFNYEFLEDFREKKSQGIHIRSTNSRRRIQHSNDGVFESTDAEALTGRDGTDSGLISSAVSRLVGGSQEEKDNDWGPEGFNKKNHPLNIMVESERIELLSHPLVTSLLRLKWQSYGRVIYWLNLGTFVIFLAFLTLYAVLLPPPNSGQCREESCSDGDCTDARRDFLRVAAAVVLLSSVIRLSFEVIQFFYDHVGYITDWENWIEVVLFICSILFASGAYFHCCVCVENWHWQLGALAIFLSWFDLVLFMKKLPLFGVYVVMYIQIIYTFLRFMLLALLFVVAFGLSFYMLFVQLGDAEGNRDPFRNPGRSLVKTMVMTTGEFEFDTIFFANRLDYSVISYILWIIFIILMPVLLANLLVGLAVDDIKQVQEDAELKRLALQVELTLGAQKLISRVFPYRFLDREHPVYPNRENTYWESIQGFWGVERYDAPSRISRALHPQQEAQEILVQQNRMLQDELNAIKTTVNEMSQLVCKMAEKHDIDLNEARN